MCVRESGDRGDHEAELDQASLWQSLQEDPWNDHASVPGKDRE